MPIADLDKCEKTDLLAYVNNDYCSSDLNVEACAYDGGDCCLEETNCDYCDGDGCLCHETGLPHCPTNDMSNGHDGNQYLMKK